MTTNLEAGKHYWMRHKKLLDERWQIVYIGEDPDEFQWMHFMGSEHSILLSIMELDAFRFIEISPPENP